MKEYSSHIENSAGMTNLEIALNDLSSVNQMHDHPEDVYRKIERIFDADEVLNKPHTLHTHHRIKLLISKIELANQIHQYERCYADARLLLSLAPYDDGFTKLFDLIAKKNRKKQKNIVVLVISCLPRLSIGKQKKERLKKILGENAEVLIVVGQRAESKKPTSLTDDLLVVDAEDTYEALSEKISSAFEYVYKNYQEGTSCFKIDEDLPIRDQEDLREMMIKIKNSGVDYTGFAGNNKFFCERTWHFGKCANKKINRRVFSKRYRGAYAYGPMYYLSSKALRAFVLECVKFPDEMLGHLYEDKFVGDTLLEAGISLLPLDPKEWINAIGEDWWTVNRNWDGKLLQLRKLSN